jgi:PD-(D/E)XK nuclease-like transposase
MLFNASEAYVNQLKKGEHYHLLKPVYGLGLINTEFDANPDEWYHYYKMVNVKNPQVEIKDYNWCLLNYPNLRRRIILRKNYKCYGCVLWRS